MRRVRSAAFLTAALFYLSACDRTPTASLESRGVLTLPSKDDVALIEGRALTLTFFGEIRATVPKASVETQLWLGLGAMALQDKARTRDVYVPIRSALIIARYAAGELSAEMAEPAVREYYQVAGPIPEATRVRDEIDQILKQSTIHRNPQALQEFRDRG